MAYCAERCTQGAIGAAQQATRSATRYFIPEHSFSASPAGH
jgi:hypothetical protein